MAWHQPHPLSPTNRRRESPLEICTIAAVSRRLIAWTCHLQARACSQIIPPHASAKTTIDSDNEQPLASASAAARSETFRLRLRGSIHGVPIQKAEPATTADSAFVFPGIGAAETAPMLSHKSHREALAVAIDPEIAMVSKHVAPTQEGGLH